MGKGVRGGGGGGGGLCIHERLVGKKLDLQGYFLGKTAYVRPIFTEHKHCYASAHVLSENQT